MSFPAAVHTPPQAGREPQKSKAKVIEGQTALLPFCMRASLLPFVQVLFFVLPSTNLGEGGVLTRGWLAPCH